MLDHGPAYLNSYEKETFIRIYENISYFTLLVKATVRSEACVTNKAQHGLINFNFSDLKGILLLLLLLGFCSSKPIIYLFNQHNLMNSTIFSRWHNRLVYVVGIYLAKYFSYHPV